VRIILHLVDTSGMKLVKPVNMHLLLSTSGSGFCIFSSLWLKWYEGGRKWSL